MLCGWLAVHRASGHATDAVDAAVRDRLHRTTSLSAALLDCAMHGEVIPEFAAYVAALGTLARSAAGRACAPSGTPRAPGCCRARMGAGRMTTHVELRPGAFADSVTLLQVSRTVQGLPGVAAAQVAMATELNLEVLAGMGFDIPAEATTNDLVVALRLDDPGRLDAALAGVAQALAEATRRPTGAARGGSAAHHRRPPSARRRTRSCWCRSPVSTYCPRRWTRSTPAAT